MIGQWGLVLLAVLVLLLLSAIPLHIVHLAEIRPMFMLMAVYYWTMLRPTPVVGVFLLGLLLDNILDYPLGMNAFVLLLAQILTTHNRKFLLGQSFLVTWAGFAVVALGAGVLEWLLFSLFNFTVIAIKSMVLSVILSAVLFPVVVLPLAAVNRALLGRHHDAP